MERRPQAAAKKGVGGVGTFEGWFGPPLRTMANARPTGAAATTRATVGRDALIPPDPAAAGTFTG